MAGKLDEEYLRRRAKGVWAADSRICILPVGEAAVSQTASGVQWCAIPLIVRSFRVADGSPG